MRHALGRLLRRLADLVDPPLPEDRQARPGEARILGYAPYRYLPDNFSNSVFQVREPISGETFSTTAPRPGAVGSCSKCGTLLRPARFDQEVLIGDFTLSPNCPKGGWHGPVA